MGLTQHLVEIAMSDSPNPSSSPRIWVGRTQAVYLPAWLIDASIFAKAASTTSRGTEPVPSCPWSTQLLSYKMCFLRRLLP